MEDGSTIEGSIEIAKWAAAQSNGRLVIPEEAVLTRVCELTESVLEPGRYRACTRGTEAGAVDLESIPPPLRVLPLSVNAQSAQLVFWYLRSMYAKNGWTMENTLEQMRHSLRGLQTMLNDNGGQYFNGTNFSLADIVAASALAGVAPLPMGYSRQGPNMAKFWFETELANEFKDLVAWRDALYLEKRKGAASNL